MDKENLKSVEEIIYNNLKKIANDDNNIIKEKIKELEQMYLQFEQETKIDEVIQFHDTVRFNIKNIDKSLFNQYTYLKKRTIDKIGKAKIINDMYNKIIEIVNLLKEETNINYAIYFSKDNRIYRSFNEHIPEKLLKLNDTDTLDHEMLIKASDFKKWATVKYQKRSLDVTDHYKAFEKTLKDTYKGKNPLPNKRVNKGHIAEAFERHLYNAHKNLIKSNEGSLSGAPDWTVDDAWRLIRISLGNDPWYTGGDVNDIQVKTLFAGDRTVTSYETVEDMFNFLRYLVKQNSSEIILKRKAKEAFNVFYNNVNDVLDSNLEQTTEDIINEIFKNKT